MSPRPPTSVVIAARNEERRLSACLAAVAALGADEVIVVDGGSTDGTVAIAEAAGVRVIRSGGRGLAFDRQLGADAATCELVAMIDADHRPEPDLLDRLWDDLQAMDFVIVQAGVEIAPTSFWTRAEGQAMATFHHQPGPRTMIGVAPALYRRSVFDLVRFDIENPEISDDADFCYRLAQVPGVRFGIGRAKVMQEHHPSVADYVEKFRWYGRMDAAFCRKHPQRAAHMWFHLAVRYPILRPLKALVTGRPLACAWFWLAAAVRLSAALGAMRADAEAELIGTQGAAAAP
jgi:glycosyltransferase involved in cell wall biosynthesis